MLVLVPFPGGVKLSGWALVVLVATSSLVLSPQAVLEDYRGSCTRVLAMVGIDGKCMTPKVRSLDGVVCVLLCVGLCRLHVVLHKMSNLPDLKKSSHVSDEGGD